MNDEGGGGGERRNLFCFRSNVRAITSLETLATQAIVRVWVVNNNAGSRP